MKITLEFNSYLEMQQFCKDRAGATEILLPAPAIEIPGATLPSTSALVVPEVPAPPVAPAAAAEATAEAEDETPDSDATIDEWGVAYNPDIHSSNRRLYDNGPTAGRFMKRRGLDEAVYNAAYAGRARGALAVPAATAAPAVPVAPVAPATPAALLDVSTFAKFAQFVSQMTQQKKVNEAQLNGVLAEFGCSSLPSVAAAGLKDPSIMANIAAQLLAVSA